MAVWQLRLGRGIALLSFVPVAAVCPSVNSMQTGAAKKANLYTDSLPTKVQVKKDRTQTGGHRHSLTPWQHTLAVQGPL